MRTCLECNGQALGRKFRGLRLREFGLSASEIRIAKSKTSGGVRTIALFLRSGRCPRALLERAGAFGSVELEHHLIPAFVTRNRAVLRSFGGYEGPAHQMA
jgi:hypothetical protein